MSDEKEIMSLPVTADELDRLFKNAEMNFESNRRPHVKNNDHYAEGIAYRQIESGYKPQGGASSNSQADISQSVAPASNVTPKPGTKAEFAHRLQINIEAQTQKSFRVKLDVILDHSKKVFDKTRLDDRREMTQQHERLAERVNLLARQQANLAWFFNWGRLGIVGELVGHFGAASTEDRGSGLARFKTVSEKLAGHITHLLGEFQSYRLMRKEQPIKTESDDHCNNEEIDIKDVGQN